ncbi:hypothetical protein ACQVTS_28175 [Bacillus mycoides]|uniref:hypothetical protein n=1 Tax=Bacillus mycoides TaxID=1405 RepID=UPI003D65BC8F
MESSVIKHKNCLRILNSLAYYTLVVGVMFCLLYLLKAIILQTLVALIIIAFVAIGFYFLGYLLIGVLSLLIIVGSVISAIGLLAYFLF